MKKTALVLILFCFMLSCDSDTLNEKSDIILAVEVPGTMIIQVDLGEMGPFGTEATVIVNDLELTSDPEGYTVQWQTNKGFASKTHLVIALVVPGTLLLELDLGSLGPFKKNTTIVARDVQLTGGAQYPDVDFRSE